MEVVFKLTTEQAAIAAEIVKEETLRSASAMQEEEDYNKNQWYHHTFTFFAGNVLGHVRKNGVVVNEDQHLEYNQDAKTLTYKGQRHPMQADGALTRILRIGGGSVAGLRVVLYKTTDSRLLWNETLEDYVKRRGTIEETLALVKFKKSRYGYTPDFPSRFTEHAACRRMIEGGASYSKINASFDAKIVKQVQSALA